MKLHKIPGVPMEVCSAEQKIAYNLAFRLHINRGDECLVLPDERKEKAIEQLSKEAMEGYRSAYTYKPGKYNEEAIFSCLSSSLTKYLEKPFIAASYNQISNIFLFSEMV